MVKILNAFIEGLKSKSTSKTQLKAQWVPNFIEKFSWQVGSSFSPYFLWQLYRTLGNKADNSEWHVGLRYQNILDPKNHIRKINNILKRFELYQVFMYNFLCQNVSIFPLNILLPSKKNKHILVSGYQPILIWR